MLSVASSIDEITMHFKGRHAGKKMITYKTKGGGL